MIDNTELGTNLYVYIYIPAKGDLRIRYFQILWEKCPKAAAFEVPLPPPPLVFYVNAV